MKEIGNKWSIFKYKEIIYITDNYYIVVCDLAFLILYLNLFQAAFQLKL